ncbi:glycine cleavage system aminomethyltransferase GcvT [Paenibacillus marinisediminis]
MTALKRTPLYDEYAAIPGVRCIDFGGWELPVQFSGIQKEHEAVRTQAGLFDVSHMGEFLVEGESAETFLQQLTTNDVSRLADGQAQYTLLCYPHGGIVDDLLVYRITADRYMLVVNASNIDKDYAWLNQHLPEQGVRLTDQSDETALIALQGPKAVAILSELTDVQLDELKPFHFIDGATVAGISLLLSRTGYTGEDGFELYVKSSDASLLWRKLLESGQAHGLQPAGLGARDTLRFEARLPLYGQELSDSTSPLEAGLGWFVKLDKSTPFIGQDALKEQKLNGVPRKSVGIEMIDKGIPRAHYAVYNAEGVQIGEVTTGTQSPTLKRNLGLALLNADFTAIGTEVIVDVRGKRLKAEVIKTPFYKR